MTKITSLVVNGILFSLFLFPICFQGVPESINSKMLIAALGLVWYIFNCVSLQELKVKSYVFVTFLLALLVSFCGVISMAYNNTSDSVYATYFVSMWVWIGAAYFATNCIKIVHGRIDIRIVTHYIVGICVAQCISALLIEYVIPFRNFVDSFLFIDQAHLRPAKRLYGIGAALDVAGSRFSCALILLTYLLLTLKNNATAYLRIFYVLLFVFIAVVGNIISRTTTVGLSISLCYWIYDLIRNGQSNDKNRWSMAFCFVTILIAVLPFLTYLYNTSGQFREQIEFGFEAFFNKARHGEYETNSTSILLEMWGKIPDNLKTWIIGDGYFNNPHNTDPYYTGTENNVYYKGTDVGYLRFIYYFGIVGLTAFILFFAYCSKACAQKLPESKQLFLFIFIMNIALWTKVSTDIFVIYSSYLMLDTSNQKH